VSGQLSEMIMGSPCRGHAGSGAGVLTTVQQIGNASGVAVIGAIYFGLGQSFEARPAVALCPALLATAFAMLPMRLREPGYSAAS
jgi:hypothetical protein